MYSDQKKKKGEQCEVLQHDCEPPEQEGTEINDKPINPLSPRNKQMPNVLI